MITNDNKRPKSTRAQIGIFICLVVLASFELIDTVVMIMEKFFNF